MTVALLGECMIEFSPDADGKYAAAFGGDTLNTALYLARLGVAADYITALGDDPFSEQMIAEWESEGIGTSRVLRVSGQVPGLYIIRRTEAGERSFYYWRDNAPVRKLFELPGGAAVLDNFQNYAWLYLSGITLSLFAQGHLPELLAVARPCPRARLPHRLRRQLPPSGLAGQGGGATCVCRNTGAGGSRTADARR